MDTETAERVSQLAKNLKDLHLAATTEEAYERAKEIILGSSSEGQEKSLKDIMQDAGITQKELKKAKELLEEESKALEKLKHELSDLKAKQLEGTMQHSEHSNETEKLDKELVEAEHGLGIAEENLDVAEQVQEEQEDKQ